MKRIFSFLIILSVIINSSFMASAEKREYSDKNITYYGSLDDEESVNQFSTQSVSTSFVKNGAEKSDGAMRVDVQTRYGFVVWEIPNIIGETYDISFYARIDGKEESKIEVIPVFGIAAKEWDTYCVTSVVGNDWRKYTCTYVCDGKDYKGTPNTTENIVLDIRVADGYPSTFYLDELRAVPRGLSKYDFSSFYEKKQKPNLDINNTEYKETFEKKLNLKFLDVEGHWAKEYANILYSAGYVSGVDENRFEPKRAVTRAEFIQMLTAPLNLSNDVYREIYSDVPKSEWFSDCIQIANDIGIIPEEMIENGFFYPNKKITRAEATAISVMAANIRNDLKDASTDLKFTDNSAIPSWANKYVNKAVANGLISGYTDGSFRPGNEITRAEAAVILYRMIDIGSKLAVYVDAQAGNDDNDGSLAYPYKTISAAKEAIRPYLKDMQNNIYVFIKGGVYNLDSQLKWDSGDSGNNGYKVIYTSYEDEQPVISMKKDYGNFELHDAKKNIYRTYVGVGNGARQVYINGIRGVRARSSVSTNGYLINYEVDTSFGYICDNKELLDFNNKNEIEFVYYQAWTNPRIIVNNITSTGDGRVKIVMSSPPWDKLSQNRSSGNIEAPNYIENAYELLDCPGEWYINTSDGYLYYMPREFENPNTMVAEIPYGERAFLVAGASFDDKVHNIEFNNLAFEYMTWSFVSKFGGWNDSQANCSAYYPGIDEYGAYKEEAAVVVSDAVDIDFIGCSFSKLGGAGINFRNSVQYCDVIGNHFSDISASAINMGIPQLEWGNYNEYVNPQEFKKLKVYNKINNNYIHDVSIEYEGAPALVFSWLRNSEIKHNEIFNCNYAGMHGGFGWIQQKQGTMTHDLEISKNYIHDTLNSRLYDGASIYVLCSTGGSADSYNLMTENYIEDTQNGWGGLYLDQESDWWELTRNVVSSEHVKEWKLEGDRHYSPYWVYLFSNTLRHNKVHNNWATTENNYMFNGHEKLNEFENASVHENGEWPAQAQAIVDNSGLEASWLNKYSANVQHISVSQSEYHLGKGEKIQLTPSARGRKGQTIDLQSGDYMYYSSDSDIATVDSNGLVKAVGSGKCSVYIEYLEDDILKRLEVVLSCGDEILEVTSEYDTAYVHIGTEADIEGVTAITSFGNKIPLTNGEYKIADNDIAEVTADGKILGKKKGETTVFTSYECLGTRAEKELKLKVIAPVEFESDEFLSKAKIIEKNNDLLDPMKYSQNSEADEDGVILANAKQPVFYNTPIANNEMICFDMEINNPHGWPSLILRSSDTTSTYATSDGMYLLGFQEGFIELQRFNSGQRTSFFGTLDLNPVEGTGVPNKLSNGEKIFEYGKRYSIKVGSFDESNGTRIVLYVNDRLIFNYLDDSKNYITEPGYFGVYILNGNFKLYPYTGKGE